MTDSRSQNRSQVYRFDVSVHRAHGHIIVPRGRLQIIQGNFACSRSQNLTQWTGKLLLLLRCAWRAWPATLRRESREGEGSTQLEASPSSEAGRFEILDTENKDNQMDLWDLHRWKWIYSVPESLLTWLNPPFDPRLVNQSDPQGNQDDPLTQNATKTYNCE